MSDIKTNNTNGFDVEGEFFGIAGRLQTEMMQEQQDRFGAAEMHAQQTADSVEATYRNKQSAVILGISAVAFAVGWAVGKK